MKYKNHSFLTKLIILVLSLLLVCTFCACSSDNDEEIVENVPELTIKQAKELVRLDKIVTEIFVCNALCSGKSVASYVAVSSESQYSKFSEIERLLDSTYLPDSGDKKFFMNYPEVGEKAISQKDGKTLAFEHRGSGFDGFIKPESISVVKTDSESKRIIKAKNESGKEVKLTAVFHDGKWLLEHGVYHVTKKENVTEPFALSNLGSLSEFSGKILVVELFVSDRESLFTDEEEKVFHQKIKTAVDFVSEESKRFGNKPEIVYETLYFDHDGVLGGKSLDFDIVFAETGFGTLKKFAESNFDLTEYDNYFFAVCLNKESQTAYNAYNGEKETEIYFGERIHVGKSSTEHEICVSMLALMGANDFSDEQYDEYTKSLFKSYFPDEVLVKDGLKGASLSSVTAFACGITDELDPIYRVFKYEK